MFAFSVGKNLFSGNVNMGPHSQIAVQRKRLYQYENRKSPGSQRDNIHIPYVYGHLPQKPFIF